MNHKVLEFLQKNMSYCATQATTRIPPVLSYEDCDLTVIPPSILTTPHGPQANQVIAVPATHTVSEVISNIAYYGITPTSTPTPTLSPVLQPTTTQNERSIIKGRNNKMTTHPAVHHSEENSKPIVCHVIYICIYIAGEMSHT
jgi:hypothetical protein